MYICIHIQEWAYTSICMYRTCSCWANTCNKSFTISVRERASIPAYPSSSSPNSNGANHTSTLLAAANAQKLS